MDAHTTRLSILWRDALLSLIWCTFQMFRAPVESITRTMLKSTTGATEFVRSLWSPFLQTTILSLYRLDIPSASLFTFSPPFHGIKSLSFGLQRHHVYPSNRGTVVFSLSLFLNNRYWEIPSQLSMIAPRSGDYPGQYTDIPLMC